MFGSLDVIEYGYPFDNPARNGPINHLSRRLNALGRPLHGDGNRLLGCLAEWFFLLKA